MRRLAFISLVLVASGCTRTLDKGYQEVQADSTWAVKIPKRLKPSKDLHPFAPIQYWNKREAVFVVGLSEAKQRMEEEEAYYSLEDYAWFVQDQLCAGMDTCLLGEMATDSCGAMPCMDTQWIAHLPDDGMEILYRIRVCEGEKRFYQLICWTTPERGERHRTALDSIVLSLREIVPVPSPGAESLSAASAATP